SPVQSLPLLTPPPDSVRYLGETSSTICLCRKSYLAFLLDQRLARFICTLEPLRHNTNQVTDPSCLLNEFGSSLNKTNFDTRNLLAHSQSRFFFSRSLDYWRFRRQKRWISLPCECAADKTT
ncbi:hypothetical protein PSHT_15600, partial [Puccinia striiformis]